LALLRAPSFDLIASPLQPGVRAAGGCQRARARHLPGGRKGQRRTIIRQDQFIVRVLLIALGFLVVFLAWQALPLVEEAIFGRGEEPRIVTPRGELAADEEATIALFEAERVVDRFTRNVYDIPRGTGSGVIWDELGHIVTNAHVIRGASRATVRLADGRAFSASLVGVDASNDLAVLRIAVRPGELPPITIGTSETLQVGQNVFAIGNPFGLDWTLTNGIVSAVGREIPNEAGGFIGDLVQTDAAINPGNSGGPLIDSAGRMIGVNTAIYSPSGSSAGIGFAVPVDTVNRVVPRLIATGRYAPPSLGVSVDPRARRILERMGTSGVLVLAVEPGSAAERAGIRPARMAEDGRLVPGDVIVALGGEAVETVADLREALADHAPGDEVTVTVLREGARTVLQATLDAAS
jgi:S1-C subfamily serine protease